MRLFLFLIFLAFGAPLCGLERVTCHADGSKAREVPYERGLPHGVAREWFEGGGEKSVRTLFNGLLHGSGQRPALVVYGRNGAVVEMLDFVMGQPAGVHLKYDEKGKLRYRAHYVNGVREGEERFFCEGSVGGGVWRGGIPVGEHLELHENGKVKRRRVYDAKGKLSQPIVEYDPAGNKRRCYFLVEGEYDGPFVEWHTNGKKKLEGEYQKGVPCGTFLGWHANGALRERHSFVDGRREGRAEMWFSDGSVHTVETYVAGMPVGEHREYFAPEAGGRLFRVNCYEGGKLHGEQRLFHRDGTVAATFSYREGVLHGKKSVWDPTGRVVEEAFYVGGNLEGRHYSLNGKGEEEVFTYVEGKREGLHQIFYPAQEVLGVVKKLDATYVNDLLEGEVCEYSPEGIKVASTFYRAGEQEGIATMYTELGALLMTMRFEGGVREGPAISYFPSGRVYRKVEFVGGVREGPVHTYFEDGSLNSLYHFKNDFEDGLCQEWNREGVLLFEGEYREGKRHGRFNKYDDTGAPRLLCVYENDQLVGEKKSFAMSE